MSDDNVLDIFSFRSSSVVAQDAPERTLGQDRVNMTSSSYGGGGSGGGDIYMRIARLEVQADNTSEAIGDLKRNIEELARAEKDRYDSVIGTKQSLEKDIAKTASKLDIIDVKLGVLPKRYEFWLGVVALGGLIIALYTLGGNR